MYICTYIYIHTHIHLYVSHVQLYVTGYHVITHLIVSGIFSAEARYPCAGGPAASE